MAGLAVCVLDDQPGEVVGLLCACGGGGGVQSPNWDVCQALHCNLLRLMCWCFPSCSCLLFCWSAGPMADGQFTASPLVTWIRWPHQLVCLYACVSGEINLTMEKDWWICPVGYWCRHLWAWAWVSMIQHVHIAEMEDLCSAEAGFGKLAKVGVCHSESVLWVNVWVYMPGYSIVEYLCCLAKAPGAGTSACHAVVECNVQIVVEPVEALARYTSNSKQLCNKIWH